MMLLRGNVKDLEATFVQDPLIRRLKESLVKPNILPDEIMSVLQNELFERENQIKQTSQNLKGINMRFSCKHIDILKTIFMKLPLKRNIKVLDQMLRHLKYMKKQDRHSRKHLYKAAEMVCIPAQSTIFEAGDEGDYMYIILKGLVVVQIKRKEYGISQIVNTLKDGDMFGELAMVNLNEVMGDKVSEVAPVRRRMADCISVENSWMLRIQTNFAKLLTQGKKINPR